MADVWYKKGLKFKCEGVSCGDCCSGRWGPGYVWVTLDEMRAIAAHLTMDFDAFTRTYVRRVGTRYSLIEQPNLDCVFYVEGKGCSVYDARPHQCRTYPFWDSNVESCESWKEEAKACPGIGCGESCDIHSRKRIDELRGRKR